MSKDARNEDLDLTPAAKEQFDALVALLAREGFGDDGPPRETTFAEIEQFGHRAGRMVARAVDARVFAEHAEHFTEAEACPGCGERTPRKERPDDLKLQTDDGEVELREPAFRCPLCERGFFPSTHRVAD